MTIPMGKKHELPSFHQPLGMGGIEWAATSGVRPTYHAILHSGQRRGLERLRGRSSHLDGSRILVGRRRGVSRGLRIHPAQVSTLGGAKD